MLVATGLLQILDYFNTECKKKNIFLKHEFIETPLAKIINGYETSSPEKLLGMGYSHGLKLSPLRLLIDHKGKR